MFHETQANEQPFVQAGQNALPSLLAGLGIGGGNTSGTGPLNKPFSISDFQHSPGYQFQVQEGENAILNNRSALGGVNSGNTLKALTNFGQGEANQDWWNAYNSYVARQNQQFNQLETVAGSGQNAAANLGSIGTQVGQNVGNNIIGAGNAAAAGAVAQGNIYGGAINNLSGLATQYLLANSSAGAGGYAGWPAGVSPAF